jgi:IMP dehydrogenase
MARIRKDVGLSYENVLLVPAASSKVISRRYVSTETHITPNIKLDIPIISANMDSVTEEDMATAMSSLGGAGILHRYMSVPMTVGAIKQLKNNNVYPIIPSIGIETYGGYTPIELIGLYLAEGANAICIDIANGHMALLAEEIKKYKEAFGDQLELIVGNIVSGRTALDLACAGASAVKVGIGPGRVCKTRHQTGCGVPQITAIMEVAEYLNSTNCKIIADGGIRYNGDVTKALAAGAHAVMSGSMFAGTDETPVLEKDENGERIYSYRGMASFGARLSQEISPSFIEGIEVDMEGKGPVKNIVNSMVEGLRSGMSYCSAMTIAELQRNAEFIVCSGGFHSHV